MSNVDFVPDEYIQRKESNRANFLCLFLFGLIMAGIGATFSIIKVRQNAVEQQLKAVEAKMKNAQAQIQQLEQLQKKKDQMMQTAAVTSSLMENVPRTILLAELTNTLPGNVSLLELKMKSEEPRQSRTARGNQYAKAKQAANKPAAAEVPKEKLLITEIEIRGIAPSDIEVASYIAGLTNSMLLKDVALVESREHRSRKDDEEFREFKLKAMLRGDIQLTKQEIESIRNKAANL
jgi:Tfp pilus assembly protein PilN